MDWRTYLQSASSLATGATLAGLDVTADALFLGPLTPIIRFLLPLVVFLIVVYVLYQVLT